MKKKQGEMIYQEETMGRRFGRLVLRWLRRALLLLLVAGGLGLWYVYRNLNLILDGPSPTARDRMALSLYENADTSWIPEKFMSPQEILDLQQKPAEADPRQEDPQEQKLEIVMEIPAGMGDSSEAGEWADCPDGIRMEILKGETYRAYAMLIKDPSRVYLGLSNPELSPSVPGKPIDDAMDAEGAVAAINSGAFFDNGTSEPKVGATPMGLVISQEKCAWKTGTPPSRGFAGFTADHKLYVSGSNLNLSQAEELGIRDGCCFGPALIIDGELNESARKQLPGRQPRTAIGQREDGAVIFLCIDGRQASSVGGTMDDVIELMQRLGAVNACNMDGGSSTVMMYRDQMGLYGESGEKYMVNSYSQLQAKPRKMPDYWMVRPNPEKED